tara:strand:- start:5541 stop:6413 length:873 start_codon:yes stop_codon:yes gene_type:complete
MKFGICGIGNMGRNHLRICKKLESELKDFKLSALYDPNIEKYNDKELFLDQINELDAVLICAPSDKHVDISLELLKINKNLKLFIEKPIDDDRIKALKLLVYSKNIFVGHIERFNPAVQKLKSMIDEKKITGINLIRTRRLGNFVARSSDYVNLDLLVHDADVANYLIDSKFDDHSLYTNKTRDDNKTDYATLICKYKNDQNTILLSEASWVEPEKIRTLELICNEGKYFLDYIKQEIQYISYTGECEAVPVEKSEPLYEELHSFVKFVRGEQPTGCHIVHALSALEMVS